MFACILSTTLCVCVAVQLVLCEVARFYGQKTYVEMMDALGIQNTHSGEKADCHMVCDFIICLYSYLASQEVIYFITSYITLVNTQYLIFMMRTRYLLPASARFR